MDNFNYEMFITLVEEREVLWNKTLEIFKDKRKSLKAWFEICHIMNENFKDLPETEKNKYGKLLAHKWKNLRDSWMKCDKKMRETKSGSGADPVHKYQYYENLNFLKQITTPRVSGSNMPEEKKSEDAVPRTSSSDFKRKKKEEIMNPVDKKMMKFMEKLEKEEDSRVSSFFKGITHSVERFSDEDFVEFQYQVLSIIRNIQYKNNYSAPRHSRIPETTTSQASYGAPSSRQFTYSIEQDSLPSIGSPAADSILNDFDFSVLDQTN